MKRAVAINDNLKTATWKNLAIALTVLTALSFWYYLNMRRHVADASSNSSQHLIRFTHDTSNQVRPVIAADACTVTIARDWNGYGNVIQIDHGSGISSFYGHLSHIDAAVGQRITRAEVLGRVDLTEPSMGSHLHYEVPVNNTPVITGYSWSRAPIADQPFSGAITGTGFVSGSQVWLAAISEQQLRDRMQIIAPETQWIRAFSAGSSLERSSSIAHQFGLKSALGTGTAPLRPGRPGANLP